MTADILALSIATLGGAAVGIERQWSGHADGPQARFAGMRTFTMLGAVGGFSGWLWNAGVTTPAAILLASPDPCEHFAVEPARALETSRHDDVGAQDLLLVQEIRLASTKSPAPVPGGGAGVGDPSRFRPPRFRLASWPHPSA